MYISTVIVFFQNVRGVPNGSIKSKTSSINPTLLDGNVEFSLKYDKFDGKLRINVTQVRNLVIDDSYTLQSPYIRVRLYRAPKQMFSLGHVINNLDTEFRTKIQKSSPVPTFNEIFKASISAADIKYYTIKFQLCDLDKYSRRVVVGECSISTKKLDFDFEEKDFSEKLQTPVEVRVELDRIILSKDNFPSARTPIQCGLCNRALQNYSVSKIKN